MVPLPPQITQDRRGAWLSSGCLLALGPGRLIMEPTPEIATWGSVADPRWTPNTIALSDFAQLITRIGRTWQRITGPLPQPEKRGNQKLGDIHAYLTM